MKVNQIGIFYFSGTGNSENVANWINEYAIRNGIVSTMKKITDSEIGKMEKLSDNSNIIFVSPVHGFNYPPIMIQFLLKFPKGKNNVHLLNTRAGMLLWKYITPGISGVAFYFAALILWLKGYKIKSMFPVNLPSNWISIHPGLNDRTIQYLHTKNKEIVMNFSEKVILGKGNLKGLYEIVQDLIVAPIAVLYYFIGRFILAKTFFANSLCNNCNQCVKKCPVSAIKIVNERPYWTYNCESCMKCVGNCPEKAIETGHGFIFIFSLFFYTVFIGIFYNFVYKYLGIIENEYLKFILESVLFLGMILISYRIVHYLMRFKIIDNIVRYTSLTKYKFWGKKYKALKYNK
jgi:ferredoxin